MTRRLLSIALLAALVSAFVVAPLGTDAKSKTGTATLSDTSGAVLGTVTKLAATYDAATNTTTISGKFKDTAGHVTKFTTDLLDASGSCTILDLTLGPLDLNLLGLMVHLDTVHLTITAQSGPGSLLGNLLCDVANLLNSGSPLSDLLAQLTDLLNQIFAAL